MRKRYWLSIVLIAVCLWFIDLGYGVSTDAQSLTYTVKKGDTLWDICEEYYGDPDLWPKLWEMNPFITNPHLLEPGDVITLLEDVPVKKPPPVKKETTRPIQTIEESVKEKTGVDVSGLTDVNSIGFLATGKVEAWGYLFSDETERIMLSEGDTVYVTIERDHQVKPGDLFTIYHNSPLLEHPKSGTEVGHIVSFLGRLVIRELVKKNLYKAEIVETYRAVSVGDPILSYEPISPCVQPVPSDSGLVTNIVAVKDLQVIIGQFSVVYLAYGYDDGIRKGNLFEVLEDREDDSPEKAALPDIVLGHVLVLETRPDTATCVVVAARKAFSNGARLKGLDWMKTQRLLSALPECAAE